MTIDEFIAKVRSDLLLFKLYCGAPRDEDEKIAENQSEKDWANLFLDWWGV